MKNQTKNKADNRNVNLRYFLFTLFGVLFLIGSGVFASNYISSSGNSILQGTWNFQNVTADNITVDDAFITNITADSIMGGNASFTGNVYSTNINKANYFVDKDDYATFSGILNITDESIRISGWKADNHVSAVLNEDYSRQDISFSTWIKTSYADGQGFIRFIRGTGQDETFRLNIESGSGKPFLWVVDTSNTGSVAIKPNVNIADNEWNHVMVVLSHSTNTLKMYINGVEYSGTYIEPRNDTNRVLYVANDIPSFNLQTNMLIYNKTLSGSEVINIYSAGKDSYSPITDSLEKQFSARDYEGNESNPTKMYNIREIFDANIVTLDDNIKINSTGIYSQGGDGNYEKSYSKTADLVVCRGTSLIDDIIKSFQCDIVCKSTDSDCSDYIERCNGKSCILRGNFTTSQIQIESNTKILCDGVGQLILKDSSNEHFIVSSNTNNIIIENCIINGNRENQVCGTYHGIELNNVSKSKFIMDITKTCTDGFSITGYGNNYLDLNIYNIGTLGSADGDGVALRSDFNYGIVRVKNSTGDGLLIKGSYNNLDVIVQDIEYSGIALTTESLMKVNHNNLNVVVNNTRIGQGIILHDMHGTGDNEVSYNTIRGTVSYSASSGIRIRGPHANHNSIDIVASYNTVAGAYLANTTHNIVNVIAFNNSEQGIVLFGSDYNTIVANTKHNTYDGCLILSSHGNDIQCISESNKLKGILVDKSHFNTIRGVYSGSVSEAGVDVINSMNNTFYGIVTKNNHRGIRERETSNFNIFTGIISLNNSNDDVFVGNNSVFSQIIGSAIVDNGGIRLPDTDGINSYKCSVNATGNWICST